MPKRFSTKVLTVTTAPSWPATGVGTFRFTDHYSVFHFGQMPDPIPGKGAAIAAMAAFNFELLAREGVEHHFRRQLSPVDLEVELFPVLDPVSTDLTTYRGAYFIPLQVIARNTVPPGSSLLRRDADARFAAHPVTGARDFAEGEVFPTPLIEFTTKLEEIDRFIADEEARKLAGLDENGLAAVSRLATQVNEVVTARAREVGLELADGKVEFGRRHDREIVLVDVAGTGDDNRFLLDGFHVGKQVMRDYYASTGLERDVQRWASLGRPAEFAPQPARAPGELLTLVGEMYCALAQIWTGQPRRGCRDLDRIVDDVRAWLSATGENGQMQQHHRLKKHTESGDYGWVISFGCKSAGQLRRLKVDTDPAADTRPIEVPCVCGEVHRVTVSPYRRRRSADEPFDLEVSSLDELR